MVIYGSRYNKYNLFNTQKNNMIKKNILWLLILWTISINFSYASLWNEVASNWIEVNKNWQLINVDWWVKFQVSGQWTLLSQYLGVSRRMLSLAVWNPKVYFFFDDTNNWVPYGYYQYTNDRVFFQWHFTNYEVCNELQSWDTVLWWCNSYTVNSDTFQEALTPFFNSITSNDYRWYNYWYYTIYNRTYFLRLCFSSQTFWQSVCFRSDQWLNNSLNLTWSTDWSFNLDFWDIPWNLLWNPPWRMNNNNNTNNNTTNNYICPTVRQIMQNMGENYNTWLCYNNTTYFNWSTFEQIDKQDIFTIFNNDYQNYTNRISIYRNNCNSTTTQQTCNNAFSGEYKKYSIIANAINSKVDEKNLWNYCNLWLNYDPNATTCVMSWAWIKEPYTTDEQINNIINNWAIPTPANTTTGENNNVLNTLNNCENWDRDCYINNRNFIESLSNIYWKITWLFKERKNVNGIIPEYILRITFMTILFTVIFKK